MKNERKASDSNVQRLDGDTPREPYADVVRELELELERVQLWGDRWFLALCKAAERPGTYGPSKFDRLLAHYRGNTETSRTLHVGIQACRALRRAGAAAKVRS